MGKVIPFPNIETQKAAEESASEQRQIVLIEALGDVAEAVRLVPRAEKATLLADIGKFAKREALRRSGKG